MIQEWWDRITDEVGRSDCDGGWMMETRKGEKVVRCCTDQRLSVVGWRRGRMRGNVGEGGRDG